MADTDDGEISKQVEKLTNEARDVQAEFDEKEKDLTKKQKQLYIRTYPNEHTGKKEEFSIIISGDVAWQTIDNFKLYPEPAVGEHFSIYLNPKPKSFDEAVKLAKRTIANPASPKASFKYVFKDRTDTKKQADESKIVIYASNADDLVALYQILAADPQIRSIKPFRKGLSDTLYINDLVQVSGSTREWGRVKMTVALDMNKQVKKAFSQAGINIRENWHRPLPGEEELSDEAEKRIAAEIEKHIPAEKAEPEELHAEVSEAIDFENLTYEEKEAGILATSVASDYKNNKEELWEHLNDKEKLWKHLKSYGDYYKSKKSLIQEHFFEALKETEKFQQGVHDYHHPNRTIIVVADAHINQLWPDCAPTFFKFLQYVQGRNDVSDLVILGDTFDFQRGTAPRDPYTHWVHKEITKMHETNKIRLHYMYGNHDYNLFPVNGKFRMQISFFPFDALESLVLYSGRKKFFFTHGHQMEKYPGWFYEPVSRAGGHFGLYGAGLHSGYSFINQAVKKITGKSLSETQMDESNLEEKASKLAPDSFVIHAHTDIPYIRKKAGNPGSWNTAKDGIRTFMEIRNGEMTIYVFDIGTHNAVIKGFPVLAPNDDFKIYTLEEYMKIKKGPTEEELTEEEERVLARILAKLEEIDMRMQAFEQGTDKAETFEQLQKLKAENNEIIREIDELRQGILAMVKSMGD